MKIKSIKFLGLTIGVLATFCNVKTPVLFSANAMEFNETNEKNKNFNKFEKILDIYMQAKIFAINDVMPKEKEDRKNKLREKLKEMQTYEDEYIDYVLKFIESDDTFYKNIAYEQIYYITYTKEYYNTNILIEYLKSRNFSEDEIDYALKKIKTNLKPTTINNINRNIVQTLLDHSYIHIFGKLSELMDVDNKNVITKNRKDELKNELTKIATNSEKEINYIIDYIENDDMFWKNTAYLFFSLFTNFMLNFKNEKLTRNNIDVLVEHIKDKLNNFFTKEEIDYAINKLNNTLSNNNYKKIKEKENNLDIKEKSILENILNFINSDIKTNGNLITNDNLFVKDILKDKQKSTKIAKIISCVMNKGFSLKEILEVIDKNSVKENNESVNSKDIDKFN